MAGFITIFMRGSRCDTEPLGFLPPPPFPRSVTRRISLGRQSLMRGPHVPVTVVSKLEL